MNKDFEIVFPKDNPDLVRKLGHHFYENKPFSESFFLIYKEQLSDKSILEILHNLYDFTYNVEMDKEGNNIIVYTKAYPICYGYLTDIYTILYFTGSNSDTGFYLKSSNFSYNDIKSLLI